MDTLFTTVPDKKSVEPFKGGSTVIDLVLTENLEEKFTKLNIEAELQASFMAGLITLSGSGAYLSETNKSARTRSMSMVCKTKTATEKIMIRHHKEIVDMDVITDENAYATHAVVGIEWGAVMTVTCKYESSENDDSFNVEGALKAEIEKLKGISMSGGVGAKYTDQEKRNHSKFTLHCTSDVTPPDKLPTTFEEAGELARKLHLLVPESPNGNGVPLTYILLPLQSVREMFKLETKIETQCTAIGEYIIKKCSQVTEGITRKRQALHDIQMDLHASMDKLGEGSRHRINEILETFDSEEIDFKIKLRNVMVDTRSGKQDVTSIGELISNGLPVALQDSTHTDQIDSFQIDLRRAKLITYFKERQIEFIGKTDVFREEDMDKGYILYTTGSTEYMNIHGKNMKMFLQLQKTHGKDYRYVIVDRELTEGLGPTSTEKPTIHLIVDGVTKCTDVQAEEGEDCHGQQHGMEYLRYRSSILDDELAGQQSREETNILILGETGVGKSTWINGFMNYIYFSNMEEAMNSGEFHVLIPSKFNFIRDGVSKEIHVGGSDSNENFNAGGMSATQEPQGYIFYVGDHLIRLIDTPGIGDSRGIEQDNKHFDSMLSYLTKYEEIHAVCILLKPSNSRLNVMFRFCIQELLAHLHTSIKHNIVFCFTNTRSTLYQPGDTLQILNRELRNKNVGIEANKNNYFCFDNESFRFLACLKNGVKFNESEIKTYAESWNKSVETTGCFLRHIHGLNPKKVKDTTTLYEARRINVAMSKPLLEVSKMIFEKVASVDAVKEKLELASKDTDDMQRKFKYPEFDLVRDIIKSRIEEIDRIQVQIDELMSEQATMMRTSARFGSFIKANAIIPCNDAVGDYLDMSIHEEQSKPKLIRSDAKLDAMKQRREEYQKEKGILDQAISHGTDKNIEIELKEMLKILGELFKLKHMGITLATRFHAATISHPANSMHFREKIAPINRR